MVQQGLGSVGMMMDVCRVVALSGAMATSMAGIATIIRIFILKIARWFIGGDGFCSICTRCSLRVCLTG
jgi:hypothetical protein